MCFMPAKQTIEDLLAHADVRLNGERPWDIRIHDERTYDRVLSQGSLGLGESYMEAWWDSEDLEETVFRLLRADIGSKIRPSLSAAWNYVRAVTLNMQDKAHATEVATVHYDLGNDLYGAMLDPYRQYTCGYFKGTEDLDTAQEQKMDLICRKLMLKPGERVLDIGCGWGGLAKFMAERYQANVTGVTISKEQAVFAREWTEGLPVEIRLQDYRDVNEPFDKIVSVGMIEHVGYKNYREMMEVAHRSLKDDGIFLLHTIGGNRSAHANEPWLDRYIFPNSLLPSLVQLAGAFEGLFVMEDLQNFGPYYTKTLRVWHRNVTQAWPVLAGKYGERFRRMWDYYLLSCAAVFRARHAQLWQFVLTKHGIIGGYDAPR